MWKKPLSLWWPKFMKTSLIIYWSSFVGNIFSTTKCVFQFSGLCWVWKSTQYLNPCSGMETHSTVFNSLRLRQNGRHFTDSIFKRIFLNENVWILIKISLTLVPKGPINNIPELVQIMAWRRPGAKPLSEPIMVNLQMHICVSRPQWVKL